MLVPLTVLLFHCYNTLFRCQPWASSTEFNQRIVRVNNLLKEGSAALPGVHIWHHRGFRSNLDFLCNDGVHLRCPGGVVVSSPMHKYWRSIRSAVLLVHVYGQYNLSGWLFNWTLYCYSYSRPSRVVMVISN